MNVRGARGLKIHLQQRCGQSAHDEQIASRLEAKTETQGVERVKKSPCSCCQKEFSTRSHRIAHERTSCRNRPPHVLAQAPTTSESTVSELTVSAPAQTNDPAIEATSAQLQVDGKRSDGDNLEHGCKPAVETKRDSKRLRQKQPPRFLETRKDLRMDQLRLVSAGATSVAPTTFECFLQDTASAIAACHSVKLNLESGRNEDENSDSVESGPKDYISEVREGSLCASIRDYLTPLGVRLG